MRGLQHALLAVALAAPVAVAAPPRPCDAAPAPRAVAKVQPEAGRAVIKLAAPVQPGGFADLTVDAPPGASVIWRIDPAPVQRANDLPPGRCIFGGESGTTYTVTALVIDFDKKTVTDLQEKVTFGGVAPKPKPPPDPKPDDPKPPPGPVTSFRVFFVYESGDNLTAAQRAVIYGKAVEEWLDANATGGNAGWRRRDKDAPGENDPTMKALWGAVKPERLPDGRPDPNRITATPCVVVEVNGKVEIIPLEPTPAAMIAKLQTYRGK